jgi:hypothetical protein
MAHRKGGQSSIVNRHLMLLWLDEFQSNLEEMSDTTIHESFRLALSSDSNAKFPISLLQHSVKMTRITEWSLCEYRWTGLLTTFERMLM